MQSLMIQKFSTNLDPNLFYTFKHGLQTGTPTYMYIYTDNKVISPLQQVAQGVKINCHPACSNILQGA